jgi:hypothetical protein
MGTAWRGPDDMAKRRPKAKEAPKVATDSPQPAQVPERPRRTPPWRRHFLRRLAVHGNKQRAAAESKITIRQVNRVRRAKPRFDRAVKLAQRMALDAYSDRLDARVMEVAIDGYTVPIVSAGKVVTHATKMIPNLTKLVAEIVVPRFAESRDKRDKIRQKAQQESVSNTLNVSILAAHADDPVIRQALLMISDRLTSGELPRAIDVTPADPPDDVE